MKARQDIITLSGFITVLSGKAASLNKTSLQVKQGI
jgi:hypothetical protein